MFQRLHDQRGFSSEIVGMLVFYRTKRQKEWRLMAILQLSNGKKLNIPGLGRIRGLAGLDEKTVTMQTRYALRKLYRNVEVSCDATFDGTLWQGICWIDGQKLNYSVS